MAEDDERTVAGPRVNCTLLRHADAFHAVIEILGSAYPDRPIDKVAAIEPRGRLRCEPAGDASERSRPR